MKILNAFIIALNMIEDSPFMLRRELSRTGLGGKNIFIILNINQV